SIPSTRPSCRPCIPRASSRCCWTARRRSSRRPPSSSTWRSIIEHLALHHPGSPPLIPADPAAAAQMRMLDRVFDNYVMNVMQIVVEEYLRDPANPDAARCQEARERLTRSYLWLEGWLEDYPLDDRITLVECAAAPSLFYADWVQLITADFPRLKAWRAHFLSLPPVKRCVE